MRGNTGPREGGQGATCHIDDPYPVVRDVGDVEPRPVARKGKAVGLDHTGAGGRTAVAGEAFFAVAREGRDDTGRPVDPAHNGVQPVGDVDRTVRTDRKAIRLVEAGLQRRPTIARIAFLAAACHRRDRPALRIDAPDAVIVGIRENQVARRVEDDIERIVQRRSGRRAAVSGITRFAVPSDGRYDPSAIA